MKLFTCLLFITAFIERAFFDLGPNVELLTASLLLGTFFLGKKTNALLTLAVLFLSDLVLGNSRIFLFTWSGFLIPVAILPWIAAKIHLNRIFSSTLMGLASNFFFFLWTNFGVWLLDSWGMYSNDLIGLVQSYFNGLPFLKLQLASTMVFVPLVFTIVYFLPKTLPFVRKTFAQFVPLKI